MAVVVLEDKDGVSYTSTSTGIVFDNKFVNKAKEKGFDKVTVGSIMAAEFGNFPLFLFLFYSFVFVFFILQCDRKELQVHRPTRVLDGWGAAPERHTAAGCQGCGWPTIVFSLSLSVSF